MPALDILASSGLGSLLGVRHALEPDHLAAVSTLVTRDRAGFRAALLGAWWGLGHTLSLVIVGAVLVALRVDMPPRVADLFEFLVAIMLIGLGVHAIVQAARMGPSGPAELHRRRLSVHQHGGLPVHVHIGSWTFAQRPLLIGAVHGLAGSGALTALVLTTLPSATAQLTYMALFGLGSTVGMAALSGLIGWPLARWAAHEGVGRGLSFLVGCVSMGIGVVWGYPYVVALLVR
jgi:hypothetical protein